VEFGSRQSKPSSTASTWIGTSARTGEREIPPGRSPPADGTTISTTGGNTRKSKMWRSEKRTSWRLKDNQAVLRPSKSSPSNGRWIHPCQRAPQERMMWITAATCAMRSLSSSTTKSSRSGICVALSVWRTKSTIHCATRTTRPRWIPRRRWNPTRMWTWTTPMIMPWIHLSK